MSIPKSILLASSLIALLAACGADQAAPSSEIRVTLTPNSASVYVTQSVQFTATVHNSTNSAVTWSLSGAGCSGDACGRISSSGLYTAPPNVPYPAAVKVKATSVADTSKSASATITILATVNMWTWVSGSNSRGQVGVYGTKDVADPANVPGARSLAVSWLDSNGNLWLFGGGGVDSAGNYGELNDLWKYDPQTSMWTWISGSNVIAQNGIYGTKGTPHSANVPGARSMAASWLDSSGDLWLFGGIGYDSTGDYGWLNDLWRLNPATLEWTWVSGADAVFQVGVYGTKGIADPANVPGARDRASSCRDSSGNFWLFGGEGIDSTGEYCDLNDLWRFDPTTLEWTWISGSNMAYQAGVYGAKGTADPANVPGGREMPVLQIDSGGNLWLFGGAGLDSVGYPGSLNDLWKYDPATLQWTWISGSNTAYQAGVYGAKGTADPANVPGARSGVVCWIDPLDKLWLFGGQGLATPGDSGDLNDLWRYDPTTSAWTWVSGSNTAYQSGVYGIKGTADSSNVPGARSGAVSWLDASGNLWLFGGSGIDSAGQQGDLNDLWRYTR